MLYIKTISNYQDFLDLFGMEEHGNGNKSRRNKILLNHLKSRNLLHWCRVHDDFELLGITSMAELKKVVPDRIRKDGKDDPDLNNKVTLIGKTYYSGQYRTDEYNGNCLDGDKASIRYINVERGRIYKKKAGKFFSSLLNETGLGKALGESVIVWLTEEFCKEWSVYIYGFSPEVTLHVDGNFSKIYDEYYCKDFKGCSCMVGKYRTEFYENSVEAEAAYITDSEGFVLCRAILFTDVTDENGKKWRLLERQYSRESDETLKHLLIDLLIKGGYIDGYKTVGASCSDARSFVANDGTSLSDREFSIRVSLCLDDPLSYQDSFKYYFYREGIAYNYPRDGYEYVLDTTDSTLNGDYDDYDDRPYDEYHEYSCDEVTLCIYHDREYYVDVDNLEDFVYVESENMYFHEDDVVELYDTDEHYPKSKAYYYERADGWFRSEEEAREYIKENWYYAGYDDNYFEDEDDIAEIRIWNAEEQAYEIQTISTYTLETLFKNDRAYNFGELGVFDRISEDTGLPYGHQIGKENEYTTQFQTVKAAV